MIDDLEIKAAVDDYFKNRAEHIAREIPCPTCRRPFIQGRANKKYCSSTCRVAYFKRLKKQRRQTLRDTGVRVSLEAPSIDNLEIGPDLPYTDGR